MAKANMKPEKNPMPTQPAGVRRDNFDEVALGYSPQAAIDEALRCLGCKHRPCVEGCPVAVDIPEFIRKVADGDFEAAYQIINRTNALPAVCGRVCPQESQCEARCVRGKKGQPVGIGYLERFVADWHMAHSDEQLVPPPSNGISVAVVGAGPAGLTCAGDLRRAGFDVTVFEALHAPGGVLVYGIPEFRLPKAIVHREIDNLRALGVAIQTDVVVGKSLTVDDLFDEGFSAVFVGSGAGLPNFMGVPGENLRGVYSANEYLTRVNLMKAYQPGSRTPIERGKRVAVIGGGNVAMDAARCALRLGAEEVSIVYRRSEAEMPARVEEVHHAREEGVTFRMLTNLMAVLPDERRHVGAMRLIQMKLGEPDASGRRSPREVPGSEYELPVDAVIMAVGTSPNPLIRMTTEGLSANRKGCLVTVDEHGLTTRDMVYAGGDAVTGAATVILAMGAGKAAARAIAGRLAPTAE
ncbi:MAG: NADPH-dependent glutamate synthase [Clostridiales bacterium]|nr:NADPH-dependent glutamate synthase [Clostridiales bacterium]